MKPPDDILSRQVGLIATCVTAIFFLIGLISCQCGNYGEKMFRPNANFTGIVLILIIPASFALITNICRQVGLIGRYYCQIIHDAILPFLPPGAVLALLFSRAEGKIPPEAVVFLVLAWLLGMLITDAINYRLKRACHKDENNE